MAKPVEARESAYPIRAVTRVCDLLDLVADAGEGLSLSDAAVGAQLPKSTAFRYLASLEARQYVERDGAGNFRLGVAFRPHDIRQRHQLVDVATPIVNALRDKLGETVNLGVLDGGTVVHEVVAESPQMMRLAARVGERGYLHSTALGKAICAELPEDRVRAMLQVKGMPAFTERTITDPEIYFKELEKVRHDGYGEDAAENQDNGRCLAVTISHPSLMCGLSVSAPSDRLPDDEAIKVIKALHVAARKIAAETA